MTIRFAAQGVPMGGLKVFCIGDPKRTGREVSSRLPSP